MFKITIIRFGNTPEQTIGQLSVYQNNKQIYQCYSLELPWKNNIRGVSCIPTGSYIVKKYTSTKLGECFHICNVPGRSAVLIHAGNFVRELRGCVAVGNQLYDIDGDGLKDVAASKETINKLYTILPPEFQIEILEK